MNESLQLINHTFAYEFYFEIGSKVCIERK